MLTLPAVALTKAEFAPFDEVAETDGVTPKLIKKAALFCLAWLICRPPVACFGSYGCPEMQNQSRA